MNQIYGIDLSKEKFDVNFITSSAKESTKVIKNSFTAINKFFVSLPKDALLCIENTGIYGELLLFLANCFNIRISVISGYEIKHSLGLIKGKSDKIDARKIREYGERFSDKLRLAVFESEQLHELRELYSLRAMLVKKRKMLTTHYHEKKQSPYNSLKVNKIIQEQLENLDKAIKETEEQVLYIIENTKPFNENYKLITSIVGIGPVTASELIIKTNNFVKINTARKAASFAGICPFPNASGKMVKKSKTSPMADKSLKTLLYLCASSAVLYNKEYKLYYNKKKMEGKHHYLIMNNVSSKLLRTVYSIIHSRARYDPNYICLDPRQNEKKIA